MTEPERVQTGAGLLVRCLEAQRVPFVFGIPGGAISPILEALADGGPQFVTVRHETAGAFMAQAYGRCTGRPGSCSRPRGRASSTPSAASPPPGRPRPGRGDHGPDPLGAAPQVYHQYLATVGLFTPITTWSVGIEEPNTIPEVLANALRVAARPRPGAVHVSVPSPTRRLRDGDVQRPRWRHDRLGRALLPGQGRRSRLPHV